MSDDEIKAGDVCLLKSSGLNVERVDGDIAHVIWGFDGVIRREAIPLCVLKKLVEPT